MHLLLFIFGWFASASASSCLEKFLPEILLQRNYNLAENEKQEIFEKYKNLEKEASIRLSSYCVESGDCRIEDIPSKEQLKIVKEIVLGLVVKFRINHKIEEFKSDTLKDFTTFEKIGFKLTPSLYKEVHKLASASVKRLELNSIAELSPHVLSKIVTAAVYKKLRFAGSFKPITVSLLSTILSGALVFLVNTGESEAIRLIFFAVAYPFIQTIVSIPLSYVNENYLLHLKPWVYGLAKTKQLKILEQGKVSPRKQHPDWFGVYTETNEAFDQTLQAARGTMLMFKNTSTPFLIQARQILTQGETIGARGPLLEFFRVLLTQFYDLAPIWETELRLMFQNLVLDEEGLPEAMTASALTKLREDIIVKLKRDIIVSHVPNSFQLHRKVRECVEAIFNID